MRTKFIELPSISELEEMLSKESKRDIPTQNINTHFASLDIFIDFLNNLGFDTSNITLDTDWEKVRIASEDIFNKAIPIILNKNKEEISILAKNLYSYLSEEDEPKKSDLIITFGAKTKAIVNKAIELYKKGLGKKLVFSGGSPLYSKNKPEAETYRDIALEQGVPIEDIILETNSISIADNVRSTLNLLEKMSINYSSIIIVNSPYVQRRCYSHFKKYLDPKIKVCRVNCETKDGLKIDDWFINEEGIIYVLSEYYKLWFGLVLNTN